MWVFYGLAILPVLIGGILWLKSHKVVWPEWVLSSVLAFAMAGIFHGCAIKGMTSDIESWSGKITQVEHHPEWVERWIEHHSESYECGTSDRPQTCTRHWTTVEYDTHPEHWIAKVDFGSEQTVWTINYQTYLTIRKEFGNHQYTGEKQSFNHGGTFKKGDQNTYVTDNRTGFVRPVTTTKKFENRVKAAPSVFSFSKVPTNIFVYNWPQNKDPWASDRVMGTAKNAISTYEWDKLNAELGPLKRINLIIIGFPSGTDSRVGQWQQAKWIGGRKNDFVIAYGGDSKEPDWVFCFGWTESELAKINIQQEIYEYGITTNTIPFIKQEIIQNYQIKDWGKFEYLSLEPAPKYLFWYVFAMVIIQGGLWVFFHYNEFDKEMINGYSGYRNRY